jgi:hypothetical protein
MCDVPKIAVLCSESTECLFGMVYKFLFKHFVTVPVAPIITGMVVHFTHPYLSPRSKKECSRNFTLHLGVHVLFQDEFYFFLPL